jgi:2-methylcitrate dehydratase PrpD
VQYSLANVFLRRRFSVEDIQPEAVLDPAVMALSSRFVAEEDETLTGKFIPATVTLRLRDGITRSVVANAIPGMPDHPLSDDQIEAKAGNCFAGGPLPLSKERTALLIGRLKRLEELDRMSDCLG